MRWASSWSRIARRRSGRLTTGTDNGIGEGCEADSYFPSPHPAAPSTVALAHGGGNGDAAMSPSLTSMINMFFSSNPSEGAGNRGSSNSNDLTDAADGIGGGRGGGRRSGGLTGGDPGDSEGPERGSRPRAKRIGSSKMPLRDISVPSSPSPSRPTRSVGSRGTGAEDTSRRIWRSGGTWVSAGGQESSPNIPNVSGIPGMVPGVPGTFSDDESESEAEQSTDHESTSGIAMGEGGTESNGGVAGSRETFPSAVEAEANSPSTRRRSKKPARLSLARTASEGGLVTPPPSRASRRPSATSEMTVVAAIGVGSSACEATAPWCVLMERCYVMVGCHRNHTLMLKVRCKKNDYSIVLYSKAAKVAYRDSP